MYGQGQGQAYTYSSAMGLLSNMPPPMAQPQQHAPQATRMVAGFGNKDKLSNDTSSKDPELLKARIFIGNLNTANCTRVDLIDLCQPYGKLKALSLLKGYAFVQYESATEAEMAIKILSGYTFFNQKLDVRLAAMGKGSVVSANSTTGPIRRPKHDFLFGGQRIRVETTNVRNRTFAQEVFGAMNDLTFYDHGKDDNIICGSCRTTFPHIRLYIEHRRQKKCNFFEREVAPAVVSCFTCKEEFNEPWLFIQHLIHRHSINLYRDQPESDPVSYLGKLKGQSGTEKSNGAEKAVQSTPAVIEEPPVIYITESNKTPQEKTTESNGASTQMEIVSEEQSTPVIENAVTQNVNNDVTEPTPIVLSSDESPNINDMGQSEKSQPVVVKQEMAEEVANKSPAPVSNANDDFPSYSSAISIGVSSKSTANPMMPPTSMFIPSMAPAPSFHSQMPNTFQQPPPMPTYQFTQPIMSNASQMSAPNYTSFSSSFAPTTMTPSMFNQGPPPAAQISLPQFMAQSSATTSNQGSLSEEEQLRMLQEFAMNNN